MSELLIDPNTTTQTHPLRAELAAKDAVILALADRIYAAHEVLANLASKREAATAPVTHLRTH